MMLALVVIQQQQHYTAGTGKLALEEDFEDPQSLDANVPQVDQWKAELHSWLEIWRRKLTEEDHSGSTTAEEAETCGASSSDEATSPSSVGDDGWCSALDEMILEAEG